jgi:hypothetical protein
MTRVDGGIITDPGYSGSIANNFVLFIVIGS